MKSDLYGKKYLLYAEDDIDDKFIFKSILGQVSEDINSVIVSNGYEVISFLNNLGDDDDLPCFILLDVNMPRMNGFETLSELRTRTEFDSIPVVMYTTSSHQSDISKAVLLGAEKVVTKPFSIDAIRSIVKEFAAYCMDTPAVRKH